MRVSDLSIDRIYVNEMIRNASYRMVQNHFHYYYEIFYVRTGTCRFFIHNSLYDLHAGDFMIIPPREVHYNTYLTQTDRFNIYFNARDLAAVLQNSTEKAGDLIDRSIFSVNFFHIPGARREEANAWMNRMLADDKADDAYTAEFLILELRAFFLFLARNGIAPSAGGRNEERDGDILRAARYITENFSQPISLDGLAAQAGLSPSYFSRRFRQVTGMGMKEYLSFVRLNNAASRLLATRDSISAIAAASGFSDSNYFKDAFKKMYGISPRAYRSTQFTDFVLAESIRSQTQGGEADTGRNRGK